MGKAFSTFQFRFCKTNKLKIWRYMFSTFLTKTYLHDVTLPFEIQALFQPHINKSVNDAA